MFTYESDYSVSLALISYIFYAIMFVIASPISNYKQLNHPIGKKGIFVFFVSYILLNIFSFWEYDTYHTWEQFEEYGYDNLFGYEDVYQFIANISGDRYFLWRCIIWAPACYFIFRSAKLLGIVNSKLLLSIVLFGGFIGYTRGMLGFTMLVLGAIMFVDSNKKVGKLVGLMIVLCSYFFHKSMYIAILFSIIALFPLSRKQLRLWLFAFPILASVTTILVTRYGVIISNLELGSGVGEVGERTITATLDAEKQLRNSTGQVMKLIEIIPQYLTLLYIGIQIFRNNIYKETSHQKTFEYLFRFAFVGFYVASLFYFTDYSTWIYERFKHMAFFPLIISLGATFTYEKQKYKWMNNIVLYQTIFVIMTQLLRIYSNI